MKQEEQMGTLRTIQTLMAGLIQAETVFSRLRHLFIDDWTPKREELFPSISKKGILKTAENAKVFVRIEFALYSCQIDSD